MIVTSPGENLFVHLIKDDGREQQGLRVFKILCERVCFRAAAEILNPTGRIYDVSVRTAQRGHGPHPSISCLWQCLEALYSSVADPIVLFPRGCKSAGPVPDGARSPREPFF